MLKLNDKGSELVYSENVNQTINFYSTDNEKLFRKNEKSMGKDWKYYNSTIEYKFNSFGYRTKEISELSSDFLLTFGCSYTEGVGLHQNEVWPEHVSKSLNLDLYNHAKHSTGMDIQCYNAHLWAMSNKPKPKLVIIQWPYKTRKCFAYRTSKSIILRDMSYTNTVDGKWWEKRYVQDTGELEMNLLLWFESFNNIWKVEGVPVLNFTWDNDLMEHLSRSRYQLHRIKTNTFDKARDLDHDGPGRHEETAHKISKILQLPDFTNKI